MKIETVVTHLKARGANFSDRAKIKNLGAEGYNAAEISDMIRVEEKCVQGFLNHFFPKVEPEPEPTPAPKKKKVSKKKAK